MTKDEFKQVENDDDDDDTQVYKTAHGIKEKP